MDVEEYRLHIHESGEEFNETLTIDEEEQTELFKVPAHRNIEKSDIMFDFKMVSCLLLSLRLNEFHNTANLLPICREHHCCHVMGTTWENLEGHGRLIGAMEAG